MLVLCEGQKTEHVYFSALRVEMRLLSVRVWRPSKVRGPRGLTKAADEARLSDPGLDEIWCVLDHDGREEEVRKFLVWYERARKRRGGPKIEAVIRIRASSTGCCFISSTRHGHSTRSAAANRRPECCEGT